MDWDQAVTTLMASFNQRAQKFVVMYMRFEYALSTHPQFLRNTDNVQINWQAVGAAFGKPFLDRVAADADAKSLINHRPAKNQRDHSGNLHWIEQPVPITDCHILFNALAAIRNNLFHGHKPNLDHDDMEFINAGIAILHLAYDHSAATTGLTQISHRMVYA